MHSTSIVATTLLEGVAVVVLLGDKRDGTLRAGWKVTRLAEHFVLAQAAVAYEILIVVLLRDEVHRHASLGKIPRFTKHLILAQSAVAHRTPVARRDEAYGRQRCGPCHRLRRATLADGKHDVRDAPLHRRRHCIKRVFALPFWLVRKDVTKNSFKETGQPVRVRDNAPPIFHRVSFLSVRLSPHVQRIPTTSETFAGYGRCGTHRSTNGKSTEVQHAIQAKTPRTCFGSAVHCNVYSCCHPNVFSIVYVTYRNPSVSRCASYTLPAVAVDVHNVLFTSRKSASPARN